MPDLALPRDALRCVNQLRAESKPPLPPLDHLPRGTHSGYHCPLQRALPNCVYAGATYWIASAGFPTNRISYPVVLEDFVRRFDEGEYPDLEED